MDSSQPEPNDERGGHKPVLLQEVLTYLDPQPGEVIYDLNLGGAGHTNAILKQLQGRGLVVGFDIDPSAVEAARRRLESSCHPPSSYRLVRANHADLGSVPELTLLPKPNACLLDLGPSTLQLFDPDRGMSWESEVALDMRLDPDGEGPTAEEIVNSWSESEIARILIDHSQERWSRRIAQRIVARRKERPIESGADLADIVKGAIPRKAWPPKMHVATRTFMALRMEVNQELETLDAVLPQALEALEPGGRLVVISFHSGEHARVKKFFKEMANPPHEVPFPLPQKGWAPEPRIKLLTRKPVTAQPEELASNPRSRSAQLRAGIKI